MAFDATTNTCNSTSGDMQFLNSKWPPKWSPNGIFSLKSIEKRLFHSFFIINNQENETFVVVLSCALQGFPSNVIFLLCY